MSIGLFLLLLVLLPFVFSHILISALVKLRLDPLVALQLGIGIILGSVVNIPVKRIVRTESVPVDPLAVFGFRGLLPRFQRARQETVIAVNLGGCVIPVGLAAYEVLHLLGQGRPIVMGLIIAVVINLITCYWLARPVPGVGIAMPGLVPPLTAAACALLLVPDHATPVAFVAGVLGPVVGADLLHLRDISKLSTGMASIGGAGTFDGIVLSGIVATYLA